MRGHYLPWVLAAAVAALCFQALQDSVASVPADPHSYSAAGLVLTDR
jgi:hypothetical protein